jgi:translation elongation factor EF-1beta
VDSTVFLKQEMDFLSNEELKKKLSKKLLTGVSIYKKIEIEIAFGWMNQYEISLISG